MTMDIADSAITNNVAYDGGGIYAVGTGRICVAALNQGNLEYVANAVATIAKG